MHPACQKIKTNKKQKLKKQRNHKNKKKPLICKNLRHKQNTTCRKT